MNLFVICNIWISLEENIFLENILIAQGIKYEQLLHSHICLNFNFN